MYNAYLLNSVKGIRQTHSTINKGQGHMSLHRCFAAAAHQHKQYTLEEPDQNNYITYS